MALLLSLLSLLGGGSAVASVHVDRRLSHRQCALAGRVWVTGAGCARHQCVAGAKIFKGGLDAEFCEVRGKYGAQFDRPIDSRLCEALHRVWIGQLNSCASNPYRARRTVANALQCLGHHSSYVNHAEAEGKYDECVTPQHLAKMRRIARRHQVPVGTIVLQRSEANCDDDPGHEMVRGRCVERTGPIPASDLGGLLMVGDSVMWRAQNELAARHPDWDTDGLPGRKIGDLGERLDEYRLDHGNPSQLIVQLGTNRTAGLTSTDFDAFFAPLPASTPVMLILPYRAAGSENASAVASANRYQRWERALGATRPNTCVADWPTVAETHPGALVDGEHPNDTHEVWYARWVSKAWTDCLASLLPGAA